MNRLNLAILTSKNKKYCTYTKSVSVEKSATAAKPDLQAENKLNKKIHTYITSVWRKCLCVYKQSMNNILSKSPFRGILYGKINLRIDKNSEENVWWHFVSHIHMHDISNVHLIKCKIKTKLTLQLVLGLECSKKGDFPFAIGISRQHFSLYSNRVCRNAQNKLHRICALLYFCPAYTTGPNHWELQTIELSTNKRINSAETCEHTKSTTKSVDRN